MYLYTYATCIKCKRHFLFVTDQTIHWQLDDSQVDITVRDVTQPRVFPNQRGQEFRVPDDCIILGHTYQVTVRGETSEGTAEFRAGKDVI